MTKCTCNFGFLVQKGAMIWSILCFWDIDMFLVHCSSKWEMCQRIKIFFVWHRSSSKDYFRAFMIPAEAISLQHEAPTLYPSILKSSCKWPLVASHSATTWKNSIHGKMKLLFELLLATWLFGLAQSSSSAGSRTVGTGGRGSIPPLPCLILAELYHTLLLQKTFHHWLSFQIFRLSTGSGQYVHVTGIATYLHTTY